MKKQLILTLTMILTIAILATGCRAAGAPPSDADPGQTSDGQPPNVQEDSTRPDAVADLIENEYDGIDISVEVLERMAILPGMSFQATVLIENNGDKTVSYVQGSGSFDIPEAVFLHSDTLQTILPEDRFGAMTDDFVTQLLEPGDSLLFRLNVMAIEPDPEFNAYSQDVFASDGEYIGNMEWAALQERFPGLTAVQPGSYILNAYFLYRIHDENDQFAAFSGPTGFAEAQTLIGIS